MTDIKKKIKQSGFHVHIINNLNDGIEYADLQTDLNGKGCNLSQTDLHNYHKTMQGYADSKQRKSTIEGTGSNDGENMGKLDVLAALTALEEENTIDANATKKMLHRLFIRQISIVSGLQLAHLHDELVLINNEVKNLETISKVYTSILKLDSTDFSFLWKEQLYPDGKVRKDNEPTKSSIFDLIKPQNFDDLLD